MATSSSSFYFSPKFKLVPNRRKPITVFANLSSPPSVAMTFGFQNLKETFSVHVSRAEGRPLNVPLIAPFTIASSRLEAVSNVAIRIELGNGSVGWGEAPVLPSVTAEDQPVALAAVADACRLLVGSEPATLGVMLEEIGRALPGHDFASVYSIIMSSKFWDDIDLALNAFEPLVKVLRRVDGDKLPSMGFVYGDLCVAKEEIKLALKEDKKKYLPIWAIVDKRWDEKLKTPLHMAGYYLNPYYYYANKEKIEKDSQIMDGLVKCMEKFYPEDDDTIEKISLQLDMYQHSLGSFGGKIAKRQAKSPYINPATWWKMYGTSAHELRLMATRILNLTTSSSACERNWSTFEMVRAGVEMAVIDAVATSIRLPLWRLFGGASNSITTDITIPIVSPNEAVKLATEYCERGFITLKLKVGKNLNSDIEVLKAIRLVHPDCSFILDANEGYTANEAIKVLDKLHEMGVTPILFEQPVHRDNWVGLQHVSEVAMKKYGVSVAADESCRSVDDACRIVKGNLAHVINIKLAKSGVLGALEIIDVAKRAGVELMIGGMVETRLAMGFAGHLAAGLACFKFVDLDTPLLLSEDPVVGGYEVSGPVYKFTNSRGHGGFLHWPNIACVFLS